MTAILGHTATGPIEVDVQRLLETRLLVQANSGGGKSWALRRLLEQTAANVQQLVIDPEGEFATLREQFDFVICAPSGADAVATPQTAALLARRLLESGVSAILDIYDLKAHERQTFVKRFLDALINAPKSLWHPVLVILDEAHVYAPQTSGAEAMGAVIDLATRGRKRGQCLVCATQRLSKLHKDVAAELLNKLIGRTGLDVDVKRAADELGMTAREATEKLRSLEAGTFFAFGPALCTNVELVTVGQVQTTHPKSGQRLMSAPPAASAKIKSTLAKLADLPQQAAEEVHDIEAARKRIRELETKLKRAEKAPVIDEEAVTYAANRARFQAMQAVVSEFGYADGELIAIARRLDGLRGRLDKKYQELSGLVVSDKSTTESHKPATSVHGTAGSGDETGTTRNNSRNKSQTIRQAEDPHKGVGTRYFVTPPQSGTSSLGKGERIILTAIAQHEGGVSLDQLTVLTGYKRSSRNTYLQRLRSQGLIDPSGDSITATDSGFSALGSDFQPLPSGVALQDYWLGRLPEGERRILEHILESHPKPIDKELLSDVTGYKRSSRNTYIQRLRSRKLIVDHGATVGAAPSLL